MWSCWMSEDEMGLGTVWSCWMSEDEMGLGTVWSCWMSEDERGLGTVWSCWLSERGWGWLDVQLLSEIIHVPLPALLKIHVHQQLAFLAAAYSPG